MKNFYKVIDLVKGKFLEKKIKINISKNENQINSKKIFCIGFGKTGTTTIEKVLNDHGYNLGNQIVGEMLAEDWINKREDRIIKFCHTANAFQDLPFSLTGIHEFLDKEFPGSKFILSVRDNGEQWFDSLVRFHTKKFSTNNHPPTEIDLSNAIYIYKGFLLDVMKFIFNYPEVPLYDRDYYIKKYNEHNDRIISYFGKNKSIFLKLNLAEADSYKKLCKFLEIPYSDSYQMPWLNKS